jgi:uncharacterized protein YeeX (DUF496 family)
VDIDLTYLPLKPRKEALQEIHNTLLSIKNDFEQRVHDIRVHESRIEDYEVSQSGIAWGSSI